MKQKKNSRQVKQSSSTATIIRTATHSGDLYLLEEFLGIALPKSATCAGKRK